MTSKLDVIDVPLDEAIEAVSALTRNRDTFGDAAHIADCEMLDALSLLKAAKKKIESARFRIGAIIKSQ